MNKQILQPAGWAAPRGYANGVAASGRQVFVAGHSRGVLVRQADASEARKDDD